MKSYRLLNYPWLMTCGAASFLAWETSFAQPTAKTAAKDDKKAEAVADGKQVMGSGNYTSLLQPLDIYAPPQGARKLIVLKELYSLVQSRGVALKVSRETFNAARQTIKTEDNKKIPVLSLEMGHDQKWSKTMSDSDPSDDYSDRKQETGLRTLSSRAGLSLQGAPAQGVSYQLLFPQLAYAGQQPDQSSSNPPRPDSAAFSATLGVSLLRDSPLLTESLSRKRMDLTLLSARETLRADTLRKLGEAETGFYSLIQRYLQLAVQERSLKLARALEADVREKIAAGESSALEATSAELQTAQAETDYMTSQIDYEAAVGEFRASLAYDDREGEGIFPDPKALDVDVEAFRVPSDALTAIVKSNPDIAISRIAKQVAENDLEITRKGTLPTLSFNMSYGNSTTGDGWAQTARDALKPADRVFGVGLSYSQVLFNDSTRNTMHQAVVSKQKADFAADETERRVHKEYHALLKKLDIGARRYKIAKVSREIAEKKLNSEYERFKAGESSVRNVIDTQTEVNNARIREIGARIELLSGYGQMRTILGRLPEGLTISYGK